MATTSSSARHRPPFGETGVSMLEFAIATPILLIAVLGFFDIIQWMTVRQILDEAIARAGQVAATMPNLDIDPGGKSDSDYEFKRLVMARRKSNDAGENFLRNIGTIGLPGGSPGSSGDALEITYTENRQTGDPVDIKSGVMVLLPGDCAKIAETGEEICNKGNIEYPIGENRPHGRSRWLMENHPIEVVAVARSHGFLPWLGSRIVRAGVAVTRQPIPQTPFAADEDPLLKTGQFPTPPHVIPEPHYTVHTPTPTPMSCVIDAEKCFKQAVERGSYACPQNTIDPADGKCTCTTNRARCFK